MLSVVVDRGQSGGDVIKLVDTENIILRSVNINHLPEKDNVLVWDITLDFSERTNMEARPEKEVK